MATSIGSTATLSGYSAGTGIDVQGTVDQILYAERATERQWQAQQQTLADQRSALQDLQGKLASFEDSVNALKDFTGALGAVKASSSDSSVVTATADRTASAVSHSVTVDQLATTSSVYCDPLASASSTFTADPLVLTIGGGPQVSINFDASHNTLQGAADFINNGDYGVTASVVSDINGSRLALVSKQSGTAGDIQVVSSPPEMNFHVGTAAQDAKLTVDGVSLVSSTNMVTGAVQGVTLQLTGESAGRTVSVGVANDTDQAKQAIEDFVSNYNTLISTINSQFTYDESTQTAGVLAGDASVRGMQSTLLSAMSYAVTGNPNLTTLRSVGVEMNDDGTLTVNDDVLDQNLAAHYSDVKSFFQSTDNSGFARALGGTMDMLTDSTQGPLTLDMNGVDSTDKMLTQQIDDFEERLTLRQQTLMDEYSKIDTTLRQFPTIQAQLTAQLGSLP